MNTSNALKSGNVDQTMQSETATTITVTPLFIFFTVVLLVSWVFIGFTIL